MHFIYQYFSGSVCSDWTDGFVSSTLVIFETLLGFSFFFFSVFNNYFLLFFLELVIYMVKSNVMLQSDKIDDFNITGLVHYNCSSLMVNKAKYIHFLTILTTSSSPSIFQV